MSVAPHTITLRVYHEDTDWSGVVYHASYLRFLERGRTEFLRAHGVTQSRLHAEGGVAFVVSRIEADYRRPAVMDDVLSISTIVTATRGASLRLRQTVSRGETALVDAVVTVAAVRHGRAVRMPVAIARAFGPGAAGPGPSA